MSTMPMMPTMPMMMPTTMSLSQRVKHLCTPAYIYFVIGMITLLINLISIFMAKKFTFSTIVVYFMQIITILFWTFILNLLCKSGYADISWILLILPYLFLFGIIGWLMYILRISKKTGNSIGKSRKSRK